ncbi:Type III restriction enzyme, res subunit [compost metagenome]
MIKTQNKTWLSDVVGEEYKQWRNGDIVLIGTGTGTGKSYFIRNQLTRFAEEEWSNILFIFNRKELHKQNKEQIRADNNMRIHTATYQEIEHDISITGSYDFKKYKYIVCDECHYFTDDSGFNHNSDISLNAIMNLESKIIIFMSATSSTLFTHIQNNKSESKIWRYKSKRNFSNIASLYFYSKEESVEQYISQRFNGNEKIIWFCRSTEKAAKLHIKYPDSYFLCSDNKKNSKYISLIKNNTITTQDNKITFDRKFLFTTKVLDNGFDLKDEQIKLIICDEFDINTMIQCIGRKRAMTEEDTIHIVLLNHSNRSINGYRNVLLEKRNEAKVFMEDGVLGRNNFIGRFAHKSNYIIFDQPSLDNKYLSHKKISTVKYLKAENDLVIIEEMLHENREQNKFRESLKEKKLSDAYIMYVLKLLQVNRYGDLDKIYKEQGISEYLDSILGNQLHNSEKKELIDKLNVRSNGRQLKSCEALNIALTELKINYRIISEIDHRRNLGEGSLNPNRKKVFWKVMKLSDSK